MPHRTLSLKEATEYLHISRADIEQLVRRKEIPFVMQGDRILFRKVDIDAWASRRILGFTGNQLSDYHKGSSAKAHNLSAKHAIMPELIRPAFINPELKAKTKNSVLREMVALSETTGLLNFRDDLLHGVEEREKMCSTALAGGIALLHMATHESYISDDSFIVLARAIQAVPFGSPDGQTTDLFFLICAQDDRIHLHMLARLCMMCYHTPLLMELREAPTAQDLYDALIKAEEQVIKAL